MFPAGHYAHLAHGLLHPPPPAPASLAIFPALSPPPPAAAHRRPPPDAPRDPSVGARKDAPILRRRSRAAPSFAAIYMQQNQAKDRDKDPSLPLRLLPPFLHSLFNFCLPLFIHSVFIHPLHISLVSPLFLPLSPHPPHSPPPLPFPPFPSPSHPLGRPHLRPSGAQSTSYTNCRRPYLTLKHRARLTISRALMISS